MDYAECAKRLRFRADQGDMGRKPDPDCDLRQAAALMDLARQEQARLGICETDLKITRRALVDANNKLRALKGN